MPSSVQIQAARAVLTDQRDVDRAVELLGQARRMATEGLVETRRALQALRTDTPPLPDGLAELGAVHQRRHRAPVNFEVTGAPRPLSPDAGLALTRTAQEALVNTAKYAPHQPVEVRLDFGEEVHRSDRGQQAVPADAAKDNLVFETANGGYGLGRYARTAFAHARLAQRRPLDGQLGRDGPGPPVNDLSPLLRVIVADDQASVREGLVLLLGLLSDIDVVASAANGQEAIEARRGAPTRRHPPRPAHARPGRHRDHAPARPSSSPASRSSY